MIQCFVKKNVIPAFKSLKEPRLLYVSKTEEDEGAQSRIMHSHEDYLEIILICSGSGEYLIGGEKRKVTKGDVIIYNSRVVHDEASDPDIPIRRYCCAIENIGIEGLRDNALIGDSETPIYASGEYDGAIEKIFETMYSLLTSGSNVAEEACHYLVLSLLSLTWEIIHHDDEKVGEDLEDVNVLGDRIKNYINAHFKEDLTLQMLADAMRISPYYLSHVFKKRTGYSPMQYVLRRRIGEAQTLLISTEHSITKIAGMVGYSNLSHFNAIFTKHVGLSPSKYRKNYIDTLNE